MDSCRLCGSKDMTVVVRMGEHPIAHRYLAVRDAKEYLHPVTLCFCKQCGQLQLDAPIPGEVLYENYVCLSSWKHQPHIPRLVEILKQMTSVKKDALVLEVGSNDGIFLNALRADGYKRLIGIEPAEDARTAANAAGITTISSFFDVASAKKFVAQHGKCELFLSRQMLEHVHDLKGFAEAMHEVIVPGGYILFEVPNFMMNINARDYTLWEEHVNYFVPDTFNYFLAQVGVREIHRESMVFSGENLVVLGQYTGKPISLSAGGYIKELERKVKSYGEAWPVFRSRFIAFLEAHKKQGGKIAFYGAGCRTSAFINFLGLTPYIEFIVDDQLEKQGKFMPGSRLPIYPASALYEHSIDLCLLGVNFECEQMVMDKHPAFVKKGGRFFSVLPPSDRLPDFWQKFIQVS